MGKIIIGIGIALLVASAILTIIGFVYRNTAEKRIKEDLKNEYGEG